MQWKFHRWQGDSVEKHGQGNHTAVSGDTISDGPRQGLEESPAPESEMGAEHSSPVSLAILPDAESCRPNCTQMPLEPK